MPRYTSKQVDDFREIARREMYDHPVVVIDVEHGMHAVAARQFVINPPSLFGSRPAEQALGLPPRDLRFPSPKSKGKPRTRPAWSLPEKKK